MKKTNLRAGKTVIDIAIERVLQMRVNRGLGQKIYRKSELFPMSRVFDEGQKISKHRLKAA